MKVFKLVHNMDYCLKANETLCVRYFAEKSAALETYEAIKEHINLSSDEYIYIEDIDAEIIEGEYKAIKTETIRYYSDDTKINN